MQVYKEKARYSVGDVVLYTPRKAVYVVEDVDEDNHATKIRCTHFETDGDHCKNCTAERKLDDDYNHDNPYDPGVGYEWGDGFADVEVIQL